MSKKKMTKRQRRRIRQRNRRILLFVTGLLLVGAIFFGILMLFGNKDKANSDKKSSDTGNSQSEELQQTEAEQIPTETPTPTPTPEPLPVVDLSTINSKSAILVRLSDMEVAAEKEADTRIYPASMTKIMTAVVGLENLSSLDDFITIDQATYDRLFTEGASLAGFAPGDQVKALDILYGVIDPRIRVSKEGS